MDEPGAAVVVDAVGDAVDDELVQVGIGPAEGSLQDVVQLGQCGGLGDQQAAPVSGLI